VISAASRKIRGIPELVGDNSNKGENSNKGGEGGKLRKFGVFWAYPLTPELNSAKYL
jgi:hypothetical protein